MFPQEIEDETITADDHIKSGLICYVCGLPTYLITVANGPMDVDIAEVCLKDGEL